MEGAQPPHRANGADRARRPKADKEGQGAEGSSEAEGRLEGQRCQQDPVPMGPTGPKEVFWGGSAQKEVRRFRFEPADLVDYYAICEPQTYMLAKILIKQSEVWRLCDFIAIGWCFPWLSGCSAAAAAVKN